LTSPVAARGTRATKQSTDLRSNHSGYRAPDRARAEPGAARPGGKLFDVKTWEACPRSGSFSTHSGSLLTVATFRHLEESPGRIPGAPRFAGMLLTTAPWLNRRRRRWPGKPQEVLNIFQTFAGSTHRRRTRFARTFHEGGPKYAKALIRNARRSRSRLGFPLFMTVACGEPASPDLLESACKSSDWHTALRQLGQPRIQDPQLLAEERGRSLGRDGPHRSGVAVTLDAGEC
jgi:hypothetical protein